jgi:uncharacterized protein involved in outer membrane biogenesis
LGAFFRFVFGAIVLAVAAILVLPSFIDWNQYRSDIESGASELTGRRVAISGDIDFFLLPAPTLRIENLAVFNIDGADHPHQLSLRLLDARVELFPLITGRIQFSRLRFVEPVLRLERITNDLANFGLPGLAGSVAEEIDSQTPAGEFALNAIRLDDVQVEDGVISVFDHLSGAGLILSGLDMQLSAGSLLGPYDFDGRARFQEQPIQYKGAIGRWANRQSTPIDISFLLEEIDLEAEFVGAWSPSDRPTAFQGKSTVRVQRAADLLRNGAAIRSYVTDDFLAKTLRAAADIEVGIGAGKVNNLQVEWGDVRLSGAADINASVSGETKVTLDAATINADEILRRDSNTTTAIGLSTDLISKGLHLAELNPLALLNSDHAEFSVGVRSIIANERVAQDIRIVLTGDAGWTSLERATALLPGHAEISLKRKAKNNAAKFLDADLKVDVEDARTLFAWLGFDPADVPQPQLTKLVLTADAGLTSQSATLRNAVATLDGSTASGALVYEVGDRPSIAFELRADAINLDRYGVTKFFAKCWPDCSLNSVRDPNANANANATAAEIERPDTDMDVDIEVGVVTWRGERAADFKFDFVRNNALLEVSKAEFRDYAGMSVNASGAFSGLGDERAGNLTGKIEVANLQRFLSVASIEGWERFGEIGSVNSQVGITTSGGKAIVTLNGDFGTTTAKVVVRSPELAWPRELFEKTPRAKLTFDFQMEDLDARQWSEILWGGRSSRDETARGIPTALSGAGELFSDRANAKVNGHFGGDALKAAIEISDPFGEPNYSGGMTLDAGAQHGLLRQLFGRPFKPQAGSVSLQFSANEKRAKLSDIAVLLGDTRLNGQADIGLIGQTEIIASIFGESVDLQPWLREKDAAAVSNQSSSIANDRPFDFSWLESNKGELNVSLRSVYANGFHAKEVLFDASLADGVLSITDASCSVLEGKIEGEGAINADGGRTEFDVAASSVNFGEFLTWLSLPNIGSTKADVTISAEAVGLTPRQLLASASGETAIALDAGELQGLNLRGFSDGLADPARAANFLDVLNSLAVGSTQFAPFETTMSVDAGKLKADSVKIEMEGATAEFSGEFSLADSYLDAVSTFDLAAHEDLPTFQIFLSGRADNVQRRNEVEDLASALVRRLRASQPPASETHLTGPGSTEAPAANP